jgi:hypothetical protein
MKEVIEVLCDMIKWLVLVAVPVCLIIVLVFVVSVIFL